MGDEMDECACIWSHEFAMRRLLALVNKRFYINFVVIPLKCYFYSFQLRQGQAYCTDTECIDRECYWQHLCNETNIKSILLLLLLLLFLFVFKYLVPQIGPGTSQSTDDSTNFTFMSMFFIFAVILYLFRPSSLRRSVQNNIQKMQPPNDGSVSGNSTDSKAELREISQTRITFFFSLFFFLQEDPGSPPLLWFAIGATKYYCNTTIIITSLNR